MNAMCQIEYQTGATEEVQGPRGVAGSGAAAPLRKSLIPQLDEEPLSR
jgi:hypothetical protein